MTKPNPHPPHLLTIFLGGHDLEMLVIRALVRRECGRHSVVDCGLRWGAKASTYASDLDHAISAGRRPVLVELDDDLGPALSSRLEEAQAVWVDHHGARAGADKPSALRQVFDLLARPATRWTRFLALVDANDVGHLPALRHMGATRAEIRAIRRADRRAQGVTAEDERLAREALRQGQRQGRLLVFRSATLRVSPLLDFLEPEYDGPGSGDVAVVTPSSVEFYGRGEVVSRLAAIPSSWSGGALPARGYWGVPAHSETAEQLLQAVVAAANG